MSVGKVYIMKTKRWIFYVSHAHSFRSFCTAHFTRQNCQSHIHLPLLVPWTNSLIYTPRFLCSHLSTHIILLHQNYLYSFTPSFSSLAIYFINFIHSFKSLKTVIHQLTRVSMLSWFQSSPNYTLSTNQ